MVRKVTNSTIAEYLQNIATAYEIKQKSYFQIQAYKNAADTIISYPQEIFDIWSKNPKELDNIPHLGAPIIEKIDYFIKNNRPHPSAIKSFSGIHPSVFVLTKVNGIGPINANKITQALKFSSNPNKSLEQLIKYCIQNKIQKIESFGPKSELSILKNTQAFLGRNERMPLNKAINISKDLISYLQQNFPKVQFVTLGSLRRKSETVGDIDIAAASNNPAKIIEQFLSYPKTVDIIQSGKNKASIRIKHDIRIDIMVKPQSSFGSLLQHFTGSRQHNILLRKHALKLGYSLSEYGIKDLKTKVIHKFQNETDFYKFLGIRLIPPENRVGENEIETYKMV